MKVSTLLATAAILMLSSGAALAAEACECCKEMSADAQMSCCDEMKSETVPAKPPAPYPPHTLA